jgi:hypothetical protein
MVVDLIFQSALSAKTTEVHYANDNCCSKTKKKPIAAQQKIFYRFTAPITSSFMSECQAGGAFLQDRVRISKPGVFRAGNRGERSRQLCDSAEQVDLAPDYPIRANNPIAITLQTWRRR